jgi:hypothetical protein
MRAPPRASESCIWALGSADFVSSSCIRLHPEPTSGSHLACFRQFSQQDGILATMKWSAFLLACVIGVCGLGHAQKLTLTLQQDLSSKLSSGTLFTAKDAAGKVYHGHLLTHPARFLLRRGSMRLVFDEPITPVTRNSEGVFRGGNKMRLLKLGGSLAAAKIADDAVDGAIGSTKARYVAMAAAAAMLIFQKGGEVKLHTGDTVEVEPTRTLSGNQNQEPVSLSANGSEP